MKIHVPDKKEMIMAGLDSMFKSTTGQSQKSGGTLTGLEIYNQVKSGGIRIEPFNLDQINPNSYNVRLGSELKVYTEMPLRFDQKNPTKTIDIGEGGYLLKPGVLYLGTTVERIYTSKFKPCINGRSSGGRLGIDIHKCAGFIDVGFDGQLTLEIEVIHPVVIKAGLEIAQISFDTLYGNPYYQYNGRYNKQVSTTASRIELNKKDKFSDVLERYELNSTFSRLIINRDKVQVSDRRRAYLTYDSMFDVTFGLYENETLREDGLDEAIFVNDYIAGFKYEYDGTTIYVRSIIE